jgi:hypothetical protein
MLVSGVVTGNRNKEREERSREYLREEGNSRERHWETRRKTDYDVNTSKKKETKTISDQYKDKSEKNNSNEMGKLQRDHISSMLAWTQLESQTFCVLILAKCMIL